MEGGPVTDLCLIRYNYDRPTLREPQGGGEDVKVISMDMKRKWEVQYFINHQPISYYLKLSQT